MKKLIKHIDLIFTLLFAAAGLIALTSPFVDPAKNWLYAFFALIFPWLYAANFLALLYWVVRLAFGYRHRAFTIIFPLVILVWGWFTPARIYQHHSFAKASPQQKTLRIMTYNTHSLRGFRETNNKKEKEFKQFLEKTHPDIILCQETSMSVTKYLADNLHYYSTVYTSKKSKEASIISRYPILKFEQKRFYKSGNAYAWADIDVHGKIIRFFSIHLQSNAISTETKKLADDADLQKRKTWATIRKIFALYRMTARQRTNQANEIKQLALQSPYPVIFAGDFNDPPLSNSYHILSENKKDTFTERGKGTGMTFPGMSLNLRIDYVLVPNSFKTLRHEVLKVPFSDHYPVMADVTWYD
ncbi:MAG TPA: hypothetical protein ENK85_01795 [Saprospiraceae bacterium]|nr:hypothetical protein [Saprospiraceae bacterium]